MVDFSDAKYFTQRLTKKIRSLVQEIDDLRRKREDLKKRIKNIQDEHYRISTQNQTNIKKYDENQRKIEVMKKKVYHVNKVCQNSESQVVPCCQISSAACCRVST